MDDGRTLSDLQCPIPLTDYPTVTLAHGSGGRLTHRLIGDMFLKAFDNTTLSALGDGAIIEAGPGRLAFSTDSFVIHPLMFPGGDIGCLAVNGTVNDLAMCGARPIALSCGLIIEEGLAMADLWRIVQSVANAAQAAGVSIVTGDTKVVDRGKGDGLFINVSGVGVVPDGIDVTPARVRPGDIILINGPIAVHGIAIMSVREGLAFETMLESDTAPLNGLVASVLEAIGADLHAMRDPTRGGLASTLNEIADQAACSIHLDEACIPIDDDVRGACEILGLDPLYVANEGKCLMIVAPESAEAALTAMRRSPYGQAAAAIGTVAAKQAGSVVLKSRIGGERIVDVLTGDPLPRIC